MSYFIANLSLNLQVKEFLKSVNNLAKLQAKWLIVSHIPFARVVEFGTVQSDFVASRVWSGRVRVVESRSDTIRPDQRQSLVGPVWKNVDISGQRRRYA